jgi:hypothetical protein
VEHEELFKVVTRLNDIPERETCSHKMKPERPQMLIHNWI